MSAARGLLAAALAAALSLASSHASAAGLYFSDRGVRPLGRGGAFVAGADDLGAVYYNPAGILEARSQVLADMSWLHFTGDYTRRARLDQVDPTTGQPTGLAYEKTFPSVHGTSPVLPIPTLAVSSSLGVERAAFAVGVWAPYAAITSYPESASGKPAPQRYSLLTLGGSALAVVGAWGAYELTPSLSVGAGLEMLVGTFESSIALSTCVPERFLCAPEDPSWDATTRLKVGPIWSPSGNVGAVWKASSTWRFGSSLQLPFWIDAPATVDVRLPTSSFFDAASQSGERAHVKFRLPWTLRGGVEARPSASTRVELALVYEAWSMHDEIRVVPDDVVLRDVATFPAAYKVGPMSIGRGFRDTWSARFGAEQSVKLGGYPIDLRAGLLYERSAVPPAMLSVLTVDLDKLAITAGASLHLGRLRLDGVVAQIVTAPADVSTSEASVAQVSPVRANPSPTPHTVNAGEYRASATVLGVGLAYRLD